MSELRFDNSFVRTLPADPVRENYRRQALGACYSLVEPTAVANPRMLASAREVRELLGLTGEDFDGHQWTEILAGNRVQGAMAPYAARYGGYQFGSWAGQLGDGRAITLGEVLGDGEARFDLQLKGAGPTPYSRTADGRAVLRSSVREFLCSEAMHHLGVPSTRALSLVATGDKVVRDMFYDGRAEEEPGAVVCRVAPSFLRFGNFEILTALGEQRALETLFDYTVRTHFAELWPDELEPRSAVVPRLLAEVVQRTAAMVVHWMRVGFVHGVMNTDNMSILGLTIDYGPYGWLEGFDPQWTPNTTDAGGRRYSFGNQPKVSYWNLSKLAAALVPLVDDAESLVGVLDGFGPTFDELWNQMMAAKLGLAGLDLAGGEGEPDPGGDRALLGGLFEVLQLVETDMTIFYRQLAEFSSGAAAADQEVADREVLKPLDASWYLPEEVTDEQCRVMASWVRAYRKRCLRDSLDDQKRRQLMQATNPRFVLRNYMAQLAIDDATAALENSGPEDAPARDALLMAELLQVLRNPYDEQPDALRWYAKRPEWARDRPGCSMLSCSS